MALRQRLLRHRKDSRWIVGGLAVLLAILLAGFYLLQRSRELPPTLVTNRVLLFALWYANVVLIIAVLFVLLRNLFKLAVERHHRILGSKFKIKLVSTYIGLSLIPVVLLFAISTQLLRGSIDRWFSTPLGEILPLGSAVAQELSREIERATLRDAARALAAVATVDLGDPAARPELNRRLLALLEELEVDYLAVYEGTDFVHAVVRSQAGIADLPEPGRTFLGEAMLNGRARTQPPSAPVDGTLILGAASPGPGRGETPPVVVAGRVLGPALTTQVRQLIQAYQAHRQLEVQKDDLQASHLLIFLMMTLLILLASSWVGLYLARRVTVPIQALADGTRRISEGDLGHRVDVAADDELGVLVESFNRMTAELASNKEALERSNRELTLANARLAEERALIATVLENLAAGVISVDAAGRILTCNGAALGMLRQPAGAVIGRRVDEAWADPERRKLAALIDEAAAGQSRLAREVHLILGGEWKTFEAKVTDMGEGSGGSVGLVMVLEDLTELIKAQQLAAWREAARRIAHEIKNPLTPIKLAAERLLKKHRGGDPELAAALEEAVEIIVREVGTMQGMVDEFSRFARLPQPRPVKVDLEQLFQETVDLYRGLKPGVEVSGRVDPRAREALVDPEQLKRVLINLLDNAVEATSAPGTVTVSAGRADGHLKIDVADTGRGIPLRSKEKLFSPYFSTKGRGTGLGLAIVHRIVADHHGSIRVEDNRPQGTVFTIELPLE